MKSKKFDILFICIFIFIFLLSLFFILPKEYEFKDNMKWISKDKTFYMESYLDKQHDVVLLKGYVIIDGEKNHVRYAIRVTGVSFCIYKKTGEKYDDFFLQADFRVDIRENIVLKNITFVENDKKLAKKIVLYNIN